MKASYEELPVAMSGPGFESREGTWGDLVVARQSCEVQVDTTEVFKSLPGGTCPCAHWGVVLRGSASFRYGDRSEVLQAGDAYYAEPGHLFVAEPGTEVVEFSPAADHRALMERLTAAAAVPA